MKNSKFLLLGIFFGIVLVKAEVISWYRIQEMFRFQSFHMYGNILLAILVGAISIRIIKKFKMRTFEGEEIVIPVKKFSKGNIYGGLLFGFGWALTGACPGPFYALVGSGAFTILVVLIFAVIGTYVFGLLKDKLPH